MPEGPTLARVLRFYPDPVLRQLCLPVDRFDTDTEALIATLSDTLTAHENGAAVAAPQIGVLRRVFVYNSVDGIKALVNPVITSPQGSVIDEEGCLSIPGLYMPVERAQRITVSALDERGTSVEFDAEDFRARVIQHETDHLDGILFLQRLTPEDRKRAMRWLRKRLEG